VYTKKHKLHDSRPKKIKPSQAKVHTHKKKSFLLEGIGKKPKPSQTKIFTKKKNTTVLKKELLKKCNLSHKSCYSFSDTSSPFFFVHTCAWRGINFRCFAASNQLLTS
jgi:hypothetical protein